MPQKCLCHDPACAVHAPVPCARPSTTTVFRVDMDDETGTPMCDPCAEDAFSSGLFRDNEPAEIHADCDDDYCHAEGRANNGDCPAFTGGR